MVNIRNTAVSWGLPARLLHWSIAALLLCQIIVGWLARSWHLSPAKLHLFVWHKSLGMLILALVLARLGWRLLNPAPRLPRETPKWKRVASHASHALLYALLIAMPLDGWLINSASGIPFRIFWLLPLPGIIHADSGLAELFKLAHFWMFVGFTGLLTLHVAAALHHHFVLRDEVLGRMLRDGRS